MYSSNKTLVWIIFYLWALSNNMVFVEIVASGRGITYYVNLLHIACLKWGHFTGSIQINMLTEGPVKNCWHHDHQNCHQNQCQVVSAYIEFDNRILFVHFFQKSLFSIGIFNYRSNTLKILLMFLISDLK